MGTSSLRIQETIVEQLIEDINQLIGHALGEGAVLCLVCGEVITEGSPVAVYAFRPVGASHWRVGHCKCDDHRPQPTEDFEVGVRELLVDGRVGRVVDEAMGSDLRVLLAPCVRAVSPASMTDVVDVRGRPPEVRMSRLARGLGPLGLGGSAEPETSLEAKSATRDAGTKSASHHGEDAGPTQLTFGDLAADGVGEGPR